MNISLFHSYSLLFLRNLVQQYWNWAQQQHLYCPWHGCETMLGPDSGISWLFPCCHTSRSSSRTADTHHGKVLEVVSVILRLWASSAGWTGSTQDSESASATCRDPFSLLDVILHCCSLSKAQTKSRSQKHHHLCYSLYKKQNSSNSELLLTEQQAQDIRSSQVHSQSQSSVSIHKHTSPQSTESRVL